MECAAGMAGARKTKRLSCFDKSVMSFSLETEKLSSFSFKEFGNLGVSSPDSLFSSVLVEQKERVSSPLKSNSTEKTSPKRRRSSRRFSFKEDFG